MDITVAMGASTYACSALLAFALSAGPALAMGRAVDIDIPAQPISSALRQLARQTGVNVLYLPTSNGSQLSTAINVHATPEQGARLLLAGSALEVIRDPTGALIVRAVRTPSPPLSSTGSAPTARPGKRTEDPVSPRPGPSQPAGLVPLLDELLVTATRQPDTVNRVALSLTALTQRTIDQQGLRTVADLAGTAPALNVSQLAPGVAFLSIRGIQNNGQGAATTGFYLDDTPLTKRGAFGCAICTGNGTPMPPLFDLERIEVLRGPQGTLFGSGSQGGTVRYITPEPGLVSYSTSVRAEASTTWNGEPSRSLGVALGGPIVRQKLGFRVSLYGKQTGGWLDYRDRLTNRLVYTNANSGQAKALRLSLLWAPTPGLKAGLAYFSSTDRYDSQSNSYTLSRDLPIVEPEVCYTALAATVDCAGSGVAFRRPATTYAPNTGLGRHTSLDTFLTPSTTNTRVANLTLDYDRPGIAVRSITSYLEDQTKLVNIDPGSQIRTRTSNATYGDFYIPRGLQILGGLPPELSYGRFFIDNRRFGFTQEVRMNVSGLGQRLNVVAGLFYSDLRNKQRYDNVYLNLDALTRTLFGITALQRYGGAPPYPVAGAPIGFDAKVQTLRDVEVAGFGEANYRLNDRLTLTGGLRVSRLWFEYTELHYGPASGNNDPGAFMGGLTPATAIAETPLAPKVGLQYTLGADRMIYAIAAKGFRAGGVNSPIPPAVCGPQLALYGITVNDLPPTYGSDAVWSYEAGAKLRLLGQRLQLNGAAYRIDWTDIQTVVTIPGTCGIPFTTNAGAARSEGFEIEAQGRLAPGLNANLAFSYNRARYTVDAPGLGSPSSPLMLPAASRNQRFPVPPWTLQVGARYDWRLRRGGAAYVRGDWWYVRHYSHTATQTFGQGSYAPDNRYPDTWRANLRVGLVKGPLDVNFYVLNLFNNRDGIIGGGRNSCPAAPAGDSQCLNPGRDPLGATYNPFFTVLPATQPRQLGLQIAYRR